MTDDDDLRSLASAYYSLFCFFEDWRLAALGERPPPGLVLRPVRSADAEWPHGALLPAIICLLRSRLARIERLRSMRRWHMLYTSHGTVVPCTSSHLSCLSRGRRSLEEWHYYAQLTHQVLDHAADELLRARLQHGLRTWHVAAQLLGARRQWGALSLPRKLFGAWVWVVGEGCRIEAAVRAMSARVGTMGRHGVAGRWV